MVRSRGLRMIFIPLFIGALVYVTVAAYLYFFQNKLLYHPTHDYVATPDRIGLSYEDVAIEVAPSQKITGWYIAGQPEKKTILFFHGNGGNISHRVEHLQLFHFLGVSLLIVDYRGYGQSTGSPTEQNLYEDANAWHQWLIKSKHLKSEQIVVFGESIGGAVAIDLATRVPCAGVIVESSFSSLKSMAKRMFPFLPTGLLLRSEFNSMDKLGKISCPILVTHSPQDDIVPFAEGERLFAAALPPKKFVRLSGGHNDRDYLIDPNYVAAVRSFLANPTAIE